MKKAAIAMLIASSVIMGCGTSPSSEEKTMTPLSKNDFQHHNWILEKINGKTISVTEGSRVPNIEVGEHFTVNGFNGCNTYRGFAELNGTKFRIGQMANTMKMCPENETAQERAMTHVLSNWSQVTLTKYNLVFQNDRYKLEFRLRDWVN